LPTPAFKIKDYGRLSQKNGGFKKYIRQRRINKHISIDLYYDRAVAVLIDEDL